METLTSIIHKFYSISPDADSYCAMFVGACVALIELLTRYNDEPRWIIKNYAIRIHILINALLSFAVLKFSQIISITIGSINHNTNPYIYATLIGCSTMAILRSSLFSVNSQSATNVHGIISSLLKWIDRIYDKERSRMIIKEVEPIVKNIPFNHLSNDILITCMSAMNGLSEEEKDELLKSSANLESLGQMTDKAKSHHLGILIAKIIGPSMLKDATSVWINRREEDDFSLKNKAKELKEELFTSPMSTRHDKQ